ncbi:TetR/AcrR family transcriptional regulator [Furfurilactobacillus curtus]|uniref:HTH tetR-type domain-containing protein n=1 Tax=Furfurilactobacillus curtus TaxID=1746200 RepID=A0ABQ5JQR1_9LACO
MKRTLSRELIVAEANKLAEKETLHNLSWRGIARHLQVQPQTLYHYFPSLGDLKAAVAEYQRGQLERQLYANLVPVSGADALYVFAETIFTFAQNHPSFTEIMTDQIQGRNSSECVTDQQSTVVKILDDILKPMIMDDDKRLQVKRFLLSSLFGYAKLSFSGFFAEQQATADSLKTIVTFLIRAIPIDGQTPTSLQGD